MAEKDYPTVEDNLCKNPDNHKKHMCNLKEEGKTEEIAKRSSKPAFACQNCGAKANEIGDLCNPSPLG